MKHEIAVSVLGQNVTLSVEITGPGTVRDRALDAIRVVMARECERFAQIAGVDVRDQAREAADEERLRGAPTLRSHTVLMAGVKGPEGRIVVREGSQEGDS